MNIRAKSEKGFSLIELLVVVAIIGVLAAVGVVGYQGYIDSTKKSVTESNAKAVHQWILNTKTVRAAGIDVKPAECNKTTGFDASVCFGDPSSGVASSADGAPFNGAPSELQPIKYGRWPELCVDSLVEEAQLRQVHRVVPRAILGTSTSPAGAKRTLKLTPVCIAHH